MVPMCNLRCQTRVIAGIKVDAVGQKTKLCIHLILETKLFIIAHKLKILKQFK